MRSGSSELLLEEQEELRKQKVVELAAAKKARAAAGRSCRESALFYSTSVLAVLAMSAGSSLLFLVPLYVDPAISTLASNFVSEPVMCVTTRRDDLVGLANCSWSSCREGCTSDAYNCTHIYVSYNDTSYTSSSSSSSSSATSTTASSTSSSGSTGIGNQSLSQTIDGAVLLVNIKGCGYPPAVLCANFTEQYGVEGIVFPCYHSRENRTVVLTHYERDEQVAIIIHYFAVPFVITLATSVALCVMHCDCRCQPSSGHHHHGGHHGGHKGGRGGRRPRVHDALSDGSISIGVDLQHAHSLSHHSDLTIRPM